MRRYDEQCQGVTLKGERCRREAYLDGLCTIRHAKRLESCPHCNGLKTARGQMCYTIGCHFRDRTKDADEDRLPRPHLRVIRGGADLEPDSVGGTSSPEDRMRYDGLARFFLYGYLAWKKQEDDLSWVMSKYPQTPTDFWIAMAKQVHELIEETQYGR